MTNLPEDDQRIPPVAADNSIPADATCQEASIRSRERYIACGAPAVAIVFHDRDRRGYYMCAACASHNVKNRGGHLVAVANEEARKRLLRYGGSNV